MFTLYTFGDSILDCAHYNAERVDPAGLLVANRDDLFPEFHGRDLWTRFNGQVRAERWARDGSTVDDLPTEDVPALAPDGPALALLTIGGNDLLRGLINDTGPGIPAFARELTAFLEALPIRPVVLGTVYDPTFGDDDAAGGVFPDPTRTRANFDRMNAALRELAPAYGLLADIHAHFLTGRPDWFVNVIEPSLRGASEVRRCVLGAIEGPGSSPRRVRRADISSAGGAGPGPGPVIGGHRAGVPGPAVLRPGSPGFPRPMPGKWNAPGPEGLIDREHGHDRGGDVLANESSATLLRDLRTILRAGSSASLTDGQLPDRYRAGTPDVAEAAFATLVERHAPMVWGCSRAVLGDPHDAEDALQATFLVLARRARSIREPGSVAGWLARVAIRAKARSTVRRAREREAAEREARRSMAAPSESYAELYEEIDRLPEKFRGPVVLCDLEGLSYEQAAGQLLVPVGTVRSRLSRARERLGSRLRRRGVAGAATCLGLRPAQASPTLATTDAIARAAMGLAAGQPVSGTTSAEAVRLARSYSRSRRMIRMGMIATTLISAGLASLGAGMLAPPRPRAAPAMKSAAPADGTVFARVVDPQGRPVPGQEVHVEGGAGGHRTLKTDAEGLIRIADAGLGRRYLTLIAIPDAKTIGWASLGYRDQEGESGTADNPLRVTLEPRDSPITGTVVDRAGRPIAGVEVRVERMRDDVNGVLMISSLTFLGWPIAPVTDDRGQYTIPLPRGTSGMMLTRHRRYAGPWITFGADREPLGPTTLVPGGSIVGAVTDATGRPVAGVAVGAQTLELRVPRGGGIASGGGWSGATTDDRGRFELAGLAPGVYNLLFMQGPEGRGPMTAAAVEGVRVKMDEDATADLTAIAGRKLRGLVADAATGKSLAGVMVGYYGTARPRSGAACMSATTDATGRFELSVPPGPSFVYIMDASRIGNTSQLDLDVPNDRDPEPIRLPGRSKPAEMPVAKAKDLDAAARKAAGKATVKEARGGPEPAEGPVNLLVGRVVDPAGAPVPGVRVTCNGERLIQTATDREGQFILEGLPEGPQRIDLSKEGYEPSVVSVGEEAVPERYILTPK